MHLSERYVQKVALFHRSDWGGVGFKVQTMCGLFCPPPVLENHESSPLHLNYSMHCNCGTEMLQKCFALTLKSFFFFWFYLLGNEYMRAKLKVEFTSRNRPQRFAPRYRVFRARNRSRVVCMLGRVF